MSPYQYLASTEDVHSGDPRNILGTDHLIWRGGGGGGGLWFFVSFRIFFSNNTRVRIFIFLSRKAQIFFQEFNIRLYDKNSESDYFFFPPPKSEYFFQQHWESEYFFRKKNITCECVRSNVLCNPRSHNSNSCKNKWYFLILIYRKLNFLSFMKMHVVDILFIHDF